MRVRGEGLGLALAAAALAACPGNTTTPWMSMVGTSLDPAPAPPAAVPGDPYPSTCNVYSTHDATGGFDQADCTCYLHASLAAVWKAIQDPDLTKDSHTVDFSVQDLADTDPQHPIHQIIHYDLNDVITFSYDLEWIHFLDAGTLQDPSHVVVTFQKIAGISYISLWAASFELTSPADGITQLTISMHENAYDTKLSDVTSGILDYYQNIGRYLGVPVSP